MSNNFLQKIDQKSKIFTMDEILLDKRYIIVDCTLFEPLKTRLAEMGLVKNTEITALKRAPLGDPILIFVRGYTLCIRAKDAKYFTVREAFV